MSFPIKWIVHDPHEADRVNRILAALKQGESRDELGLGGIRDSLADLLFPGTSTIQTRLRYFLIVAWCYRSVESKGVRAPRFGKRVADLERTLIPMLKRQEDADGVFGRVAGQAIKRLPSSVYWSGLERWGVRRVAISQSQYHRDVDRYLDAAARVLKTEEGEEIRRAPKGIWDPNLPDIPKDFESSLSFALTPEEADFLTQRIEASARGSMLAWLARRPDKAADVEGAAHPWSLPCHAELPEDIQGTLHQAQLVSRVTHGAAQLYNLMLAELGEDDHVRKVRENRLQDLEAWRRELEGDWGALEVWEHDTLKARCARAPGHHISPQTWRFLRDWNTRVRETRGAVWADEEARALVRAREFVLKRRGGRSRFVNKELRAQWTGAAGLGRLDFRWAPVRRLLADLYAARSPS